MDCPGCNQSGLPETAKFCPECGTRLSDGPEPVGTRIEVNTSVGTGDATGLEVGEIRGPVKVVHNNLFIGDPSPELLARIGTIKAVPTEVKAREVADPKIVPDLQQLPQLEEQVDSLLGQVRAAERHGQRVDGIQVGNVHLSRVELLVKQAVLLKTEADQMFLDALDRNREQIDQTKASSPSGSFELDLGGLMEGLDEGEHEAKLREALELLRQANHLDPTNAEVLLHMAQVMDQLEEDARETQRLLLRVQNLLEPPRNELDRFHLAQAKFLSAVSSEYTHPELLRSAREIFAQLGRNDWVRQCNDLLAAEQQPNPSSPSGSVLPPQPPLSAGFQPIGTWQARMSNGGTITLGLDPTGGMQGVQSHAMLGMEVPFGGQWQFDQTNHVLWLQGLVHGVSPFALQIAIQGEQGGGYHAVGSDGIQYFLTRAG